MKVYRKKAKNQKDKHTKQKWREAEGERFPGPEKHRARFAGPEKDRGEVSSPAVSAATGRASREGEDGSSAKRCSFSLVWLWRRMQQQQQLPWRIAGEAVAYVWSSEL